MKTDAGRMPNRVGIESRLAIVDQKSRVGDWEVDLIVGERHKGYLLTLAERKTKLLLMCQLANKQADTVRRAIIRLLKPYKRWVHTITADNGAEFAKHEGFAKQLGAAVYFADPYASWQRGLSEHTNGLVREYFPKGDRLTGLNSSEVRLMQDRINLRPRKVLGYGPIRFDDPALNRNEAILDEFEALWIDGNNRVYPRRPNKHGFYVLSIAELVIEPE